MSGRNEEQPDVWAAPERTRDAMPVGMPAGRAGRAREGERPSRWASPVTWALMLAAAGVLGWGAYALLVVVPTLSTGWDEFGRVMTSDGASAEIGERAWVLGLEGELDGLRVTEESICADLTLLNPNESGTAPGFGPITLGPQGSEPGSPELVAVRDAPLEDGILPGGRLEREVCFDRGEAPIETLEIAVGAAGETMRWRLGP